jgi:aconitate hydratase
MVFDLELIKKIYSTLPAKVEAARKLVGKPLTLTEKFYMHTYPALYQLRPITGVKIM